MARRECLVRGGLLVGLLVLAADGWADEDTAVKEIERLGGDVERDVKRDEKRPSKPVVGVQLARRQITDANLKLLKEFKNLRGLVLNGASITDAGLKEIKDITTLEGLYLDSTKLTDTGLKRFRLGVAASPAQRRVSNRVYLF